MKRVLAAVLVLASAAALAEKADQDKPTQIEANRMSADDAQRMNVFEGKVVLTKGTIRVTAERIVVRQNAEGFQSAVATGSPVRFRQRQDPKPGESEGVWVEGEARRIEIDDRNQKIELFEQARVSRGGDEVKGNYIYVDQRSGFFSVTGGAGDPDARVRAIIQSKPAPAESGK
jgi:lipopolysaccharide export system protein LptA